MYKDEIRCLILSIYSSSKLLKNLIEIPKTIKQKIKYKTISQDVRVFEEFLDKRQNGKQD